MSSPGGRTPASGRLTLLAHGIAEERRGVARCARYVTSLADRTIAALRTTHDQLAGIVPGLSDEQLGLTSGASEWPVSQVLSHLGSGAEITLAGYVAALAGDEPPGQDFNQPIWDRWNALAPREQAAAFPRAQRGAGGLARGPVARRPREPPDQPGLPARPAVHRLGGRDEAARGRPALVGRARGRRPRGRDRRRRSPAALRPPRRRPGLPARASPARPTSSTSRRGYGSRAPT